MKEEAVDEERQPPRGGRKEVPGVFRKRRDGDPTVLTKDLDHGKQNCVK